MTERFDIDVNRLDSVESYITKDDQPSEDAGLEQRCGGAGEIEMGTKQDEFGNWDTEIYPCAGCPDCECPLRPRLLDLFCGAGGAAVGYHRAGFDVVGVDINPQPHYPFPFVEADALEFLREMRILGPSVWAFGTFDAIHASPPCQAYTHARHIANRGRDDHPRLIDPVRNALELSGLPYVIENVVEAPLHHPVTVCGVSLGLNVKRHRLFESNVALMVPPCACGDYRKRRYASTPRLDGSRPLSRYVNPLASDCTHDEFAEAMGIDWIPARGKRPAPGLHEAIPPAYTEHIGHYLMAELKARAAA